MWLACLVEGKCVLAQLGYPERAFFLPCCQDSCSFLTLILFCSSRLQSTRVEFDLPEYSVRRRYQDFDWLRNKLEESQPTHLIPVGTKSVQLVTHFSFFLFPDRVHSTLTPQIMGKHCLTFYTRSTHQLFILWMLYNYFTFWVLISDLLHHMLVSWVEWGRFSYSS